MPTRTVSTRSAIPSRRLSRLPDWVVTASIVALFLLVFVVRSSVYNPNDGIGLFFCIPIAVAAVRFGPIIGLIGGLFGFGLYVIWAHTTPQVNLNALSYSSRLVVFLVLGGFVGYFARARARLDVRSRNLFDLSPDFLGTLDAGGRVVTANDAWRSAVLGDGAKTREWRFRIPVSTDSSVVEEEIQLPDGAPRTFEWRVQQDPQDQLTYVVGRDVTERIEREAHVRRLLNEVQDARAAERSRIASDLHDFVLQQLLVALMHIERLDSDAVTELDRFVRTAVKSLRGVIDGIQPLDFQHLECSALMERVATAVEDEWAIEVDREVDVTSPIDEETKLLAFRIAGEALRNAAKHSGAERVSFNVSEQAGFLAIRVNDRGSGLARDAEVHDALVALYGTGFNLLIEHVLASGGHFTLKSRADEGVNIAVELPIESSKFRL